MNCKHLLSQAARFHLSRPLRRCQITQSLLPQSFGIKFTLANDNQDDVWLVHPTVPRYRPSLDTATTTTTTTYATVADQTQGQGLWAVANRTALNTFVGNPAHGATKKKNPKGLRSSLHTRFKHKRFDPRHVKPIDLRLDVNVVHSIEMQLLEDCYHWYEQCLDANVEALLAHTVSPGIFHHVQERAQAVAQELEWGGGGDSSSTLRHGTEYVVFHWQQHLTAWGRLRWFVSGGRTTTATVLLDETDLATVEWGEDPRIGLVVAFQRMELFRQEDVDVVDQIKNIR